MKRKQRVVVKARESKAAAKMLEKRQGQQLRNLGRNLVAAANAPAVLLKAQRECDRVRFSWAVGPPMVVFWFGDELVGTWPDDE